MAKIAVDFGTGNTVLARYNESLGRAATIEIPSISTAFRYRLSPDAPEQTVHVVPSLTYYSETETLIGDQVLSRGLAEHRDTFRWFTAPTEAFEDFQDWLHRLCESLGVRRLRMKDEPTVCVLGYHGAARKDEPFVVFDFGCGTLDVSAIRLDTAATDDRKAVQLGRAGRDLGGLDVDHWLAEDFCQRHSLGERERRGLEAVILRQAEAAKIALSDPTVDEADVQVVNRVERQDPAAQHDISPQLRAVRAGSVSSFTTGDYRGAGWIVRSPPSIPPGYRGEGRGRSGRRLLGMPVAGERFCETNARDLGPGRRECGGQSGTAAGRRGQGSGDGRDQPGTVRPPVAARQFRRPGGLSESVRRRGPRRVPGHRRADSAARLRHRKL